MFSINRIDFIADHIIPNTIDSPELQQFTEDSKNEIKSRLLSMNNRLVIAGLSTVQRAAIMNDIWRHAVQEFVNEITEGE